MGNVGLLGRPGAGGGAGPFRAGGAGQPDRRLLRRTFSGPPPRPATVPATVAAFLLAIVVATGAGAATALGPMKAMAGLAVLLVLAAVWRWPALAAYLVIVVTPLTVGISRGGGLPLRPNEVLDVLVAVGLAARGVARLRTGRIPGLRLDGVEWSMLLLAVCGSALPLLTMVVRQRPISLDDLLYALVLWKLAGLYAIVRLSVRTDAEIRRCLWLSVWAAYIVAAIAILQSLNVAGISGLISTFYSYSPNGQVAAGARGSSTLGLPAATAALMIFNLAIVSGLWIRYRRHPLFLGAAAALFIFGTLAAGEITGIIGLIVSLVCIAIVTRSPRLLALFIPAGLAGSGVLRSVIDSRLVGFNTTNGLPASWFSRLSNLRTYFWPKLFSDWNFLLGVRPAARIPIASQTKGAEGYVWIESGYTWLLWGGGIPLFASYVFFVLAGARRGWLAVRYGMGSASVAGGAAFVAVIVTAVSMLFDPHLTYRGSGDALFVLLALAAPRWARSGERYAPAERTQQAVPPYRGALQTGPRSEARGDAEEGAAKPGGGGSIVTPDDEARSGASAAVPSGFSPDGGTAVPRGATGPEMSRDGRIASANLLKTAGVDKPPGGRGQWPRFLKARLPGILAITVAVTAGAAALASLQTPQYKSQATVVAYPATTEASNEAQATVMGTEQEVAQSGAVVSAAARQLHVPENTLAAGLTISAPANSYLLNIAYTGPNPQVAQRRAQAIAGAYVAFHAPVRQAAPSQRTTTAAPVSSLDAAIVTPASLPTARSSPKIALDTGAGLVLGVVLGFGFALVRDRMDHRLRGPADLEAQSGARVLAVIPAIRRARHDGAGGLVILRSPGSAPADAFRTLRTRVVQVAAWRGARTVLVASPEGEDEALVSANLAAALALAGRHVVLVCADLRRRRTQDLFNVTGRAGLTSVLDGNSDVAGALERTDVAGLEILPSGPASGDPAAVPQSQGLPGVLAEISHQADFVIIDAPPILAGPDTGVLGELADMVLLVAEVRRSTRLGVHAAAREMEQIQAAPGGSVLVKVGRRWHMPKLRGHGRRPHMPKLPGSGRRWHMPKLPGSGRRPHMPKLPDGLRGLHLPHAKPFIFWRQKPPT